MNTSARIMPILWLVALIATLGRPNEIRAQINHSPQWSGAFDLSYGLVDLDNFAQDDFSYCRWGNLLSKVSFNSTDLSFTWLTKGPFTNSNNDLFLARVLPGFKQRVTFLDQPFPATASWTPPIGISPGSLRITNPDLNLVLYRYLHFPNSLVNQSTGTSLPSTARKLIILIHGWNSSSLSDQINGASTQEFLNLSRGLQQQVASSDWAVVHYRWEPDADTGQFDFLGSLISFGGQAATDAAEAATISNLHGQHLGELLSRGYPNLEKIQLIAHSAGAWAARSAARYILQNSPNCAVQLTLLDPFIPAVVTQGSVLSTKVMSDLDAVPGNAQLRRLENYYSVQFFVAGTQETFTWRSFDLNQRVDWSPTLLSSYYADHAGPIGFYSDTVIATTVTQPPGLANFDVRPGSSSRVGWTRSLFYNEPLIFQGPQSQSVAIGSPLTLTALAGSRNSSAADAAVAIQWMRNGSPIPGATGTFYRITSFQANDAADYSVRVSNFAGVSTSSVASVGLASTLAISVQPQSQVLTAGNNLLLSVNVTGNSGPVTYQWRFNGSPITNAVGSSYNTTNVGIGFTGSFDVVVTEGTRSVTSIAATIVVNPVSRLSNLSILTNITSETPGFTIGTVIGGAGTTGAKPLLVRAVGPSLTPLGVAGAISDPSLTIFSGQSVIASNDNWGGVPATAAAMNQVGAFALADNASKDAAVYNQQTASGAYTVQVRGVGSSVGAVIAEFYDATPPALFTTATPRLINVSVLRQINAGEILTAGFVVAGTAPKQILLRAIGPTLSLSPFNVAGAMANPKIDLFSGQTVIGTNNDWGGGSLLTAAFVKVGAFTLGGTSKDAALLATLAPGNYTAQVTGFSASSGVALVEVYEVP